jgi:hypothetical protein
MMVFLFYCPQRRMAASTKGPALFVVVTTVFVCGQNWVTVAATGVGSARKKVMPFNIFVI